MYNPTTVSQAVVNAELRARIGSGISEQNGYTYVDGTMLANVISPVIARAIAIGRVVRPVIGATEEFVNVIDVEKVLNVTVQIPNMLGVTTRTVGNGGTTGNSGLINRAKKIMPSSTPFNIPLAQVNDQALFFPKLMLTMALYDVVVETLASYADTVIISMDSYHMAKAIAYSLYRAGIEAKAHVSLHTSTIKDADDFADSNFDPSNIVRIDTSRVYEENYMIKVINELTAKMSKGDIEKSAMAFTGNREIVSRIDLINWMTTPKTGFISNNCDYGQRLVLEPNFSLDTATRNGSMLRVEATVTKGYALYEANDILFQYTAKWLGLEAEALDGVLGVVFTPQAYAMGGASTAITNLVQSSEYDGVVCFTYQKFGGAAYRKMFLLTTKDYVLPASLYGTFAGEHYIECTSSDIGALTVVADSATPTATQIKIVDTGISGITAGKFVKKIASAFAPLASQKPVVAPTEWDITTYTDLEDSLNNGGSTFAMVEPALGIPTDD